VVVAEVFVAECWRAAAVAGGEDVAALVAFGLHGVCPPVLSVKVFKRKDLSPDFVRVSGRGLKCEGPAFMPGLLVSISILVIHIKLMGMFFCACKCHLLGGLWGFPRVWGVDSGFRAVRRKDMSQGPKPAALTVLDVQAEARTYLRSNGKNSEATAKGNTER
jgi:hypothetical protein